MFFDFSSMLPASSFSFWKPSSSSHWHRFKIFWWEKKGDFIVEDWADSGHAQFLRLRWGIEALWTRRERNEDITKIQEFKSNWSQIHNAANYPRTRKKGTYASTVSFSSSTTRFEGLPPFTTLNHPSVEGTQMFKRFVFVLQWFETFVQT